MERRPPKPRRYLKGRSRDPAPRNPPLHRAPPSPRLQQQDRDPPQLVPIYHSQQRRRSHLCTAGVDTKSCPRPPESVPRLASLLSPVGHRCTKELVGVSARANHRPGYVKGTDWLTGPCAGGGDGGCEGRSCTALRWRRSQLAYCLWSPPRRAEDTEALYSKGKHSH